MSTSYRRRDSVDSITSRDGSPSAEDAPLLPRFSIESLESLSPEPSIHDAVLTPEASANFFSRLWFLWSNPLLSLGYTRPLEVPDLYRLPDERSSARMAFAILTSFERRHREAATYNERLANGEIAPGMRSLWWSLRGIRAEREHAWRVEDGKRKASLVLAINDSIKWRFWSAGVLKLISDTARITSPLVAKAIIVFATESHAGYVAGTPTPPVERGIGLCFALFALQLIASWCNQHHIYRSMTCGTLVRGGLITAIYSKALSMSPRARARMTGGKLISNISTDVSGINSCLANFHMSWTVPIQLGICLVLLLINLGPSALAGFALLVVTIPIKTVTVKRLFSVRKQSMGWTDKRSKLLHEMLSGIRVIKFFSWEVPFLKRISEYRTLETGYIRTLSMLRAGLTAFSASLPTLAAMIAFITYSLTGHPLTAANVFSSLILFRLMKLPLRFFPTSLSFIADALVACERLHDVFEAEMSAGTLVIHDGLDVAVCIDGAEFTWDGPPPKAEDSKATSAQRGKRRKTKPETPPEDSPVDEADVFRLRGIDMKIPRGELVAVVGAIGAGKTSLLQGIIGEMRRTRGAVEFGGSVAYCAQTAWIQNASIRENVCFGRPFEEKRYWKAVRDSCLEADLEMLPNYDLTEVGEKGISLSGGQKQRVNICRAIYSDADIMIFDDPFSALDAHVGEAVFSNVLKRSTAGKTRILVTHALHFLHEVDHIYTLIDGRIAEHGDFRALMAANGAFCKFVDEFGLPRKNAAVKAKGKEKAETDHDEKKVDDVGAQRKGMMQDEERRTGAITFSVYRQYLSAGNGMVLVPILLLTLAVMQGWNIVSSYWLVYWSERRWNYSQGFYMGIYAALNVSQALSVFFVGVSFAIMTCNTSRELHERAITRVLRAPMRFFETTPLGRIMNCFAKDVDTINNRLGDALRMVSITGADIAGAVIFISIILPWFVFVAAFFLMCYFSLVSYYQATARELIRLDAILRGSLYAHFSESLSGLTTISAYGERDRFKRENVELVDIENRALWMNVANQRWLGMRLDILGAILSFTVAILTVGTRFSISSGQTGLVLAYVITVQQSFGIMVRQVADVENSMSAVERIVYYANEVEQEGPYEVEDGPAPASWPSKGRIVMKDVFMKYRPELPDVLRGLSMDVAPGEKIGIVGRTGAGKSSIMTALYRLVELSSGSIQIDGIDISRVGLDQLRKGLAIIPQDSFLFSGTLRSNLDPFGLFDDARLWDALRRAHLVNTDDVQCASPQTMTQGDAHVVGGRFNLDTSIAIEGSNLSVGQRSLVSLARALVHETKILILDEATASVDYETDAKIQKTIATEFEDRTILCIAHRLRTILSFDRICVLDAGVIAEFDTPSDLFDVPGGIFRGMCDKSLITRQDVLSASKQNRSRS